ncbi:hypothetical protein BsIDN1_50200 [Bacillus safensis]|uniref:PHP domain-containing protein n=1 Tax=Bacillus safensis TaxID=561879 RepID=A0A5S9MFK2_BACIA|nr:hypothetical protein BsIDN1_50200 [Bacillus safensis]
MRRKNGTALELNSNPSRLDLKTEHLMKANEAGVNIMINTDAHNIAMLDHMEVGVTAARKGWTPKSKCREYFFSKRDQKVFNA